MSSNSTLLSVLAAINKQNKSTTPKSSGLPTYSGGGTSVVNPKTSKGSTHDGGSSILGGIANIAGNLASDVKDTVTGIPGGLIQTAEHPIATGEAIAKDYKRRYGPLLGYLNGGGDIGKFGHIIAQHPLAPILDASSVLTGGGALAAKIGQSAHVADAVEAGTAGTAATKLFNATKGGTRLMKVDKTSEGSGIRVPLPSNPVIRMRRNAALNVQEKLPAGFGGPLSLRARAGKAAVMQQMGHAANKRGLIQQNVEQAAAHIEKVAGTNGNPSLHVMHTVADHIINGTSPKEYANLLKKSRADMAPIGTQAKHDAETAKLVAHHSSKPVNDLYHATQKAMAERQLKAGGAVTRATITDPAVEALMKYRDAHSAAALDAAKHWVAAGKFTQDQLDAQRVLQHNLVREAQGRKPLTAAQTDALFAKVGLPPVSYNPDTLLAGDARKVASAASSKGVLYKQGTRIFNPQNIVDAHHLASHATDAIHAHDMMLSVAKHIPEGKNKPTGWVWVKDKIPPTIHDKFVTHEGQRATAPHTAAAFYEAIKSTQAPVGRMAVPEHLYHDIAQGQSGMAAARIEAVSKAASVWKHMTLGFRPGFLTTNIGSNQWMFHMKNGWNIPSMLRARKALSSGVAKEFHAAETSGGSTWGGFEKMKGAEKAGSKTAKAKGLGNVLYDIVGKHEHQLRTLSMYETARRLPQVRRELRALKGGKYNPAEHGGRTMFHEAYARAVAKHPHIQDLVTKNIDDAAGNYRYFTHAEQMLKNVVPFYSWDRHSVRGLVRLIEDHPAKMALLNQLGVQGQERYKRDFGATNTMPEFTRSYVQDGYIGALAKALGLGDHVNMLDTRSQNPYQTAADVLQTFTGSQGQQQRAISGLLGPLAAAPIEQFMGKSLLTGGPLPKSDFKNPILQALERTGKSIPPLKFVTDLATNAGAQKKMLPATRGQTVSGYFGIYLRNLDKKVAQKVEKTQAAADAKLNSGPRKHKQKVSAIPYPNSP